MGKSEPTGASFNLKIADMDRLPYLDLQAQYHTTGTEVLAALGKICESGRFAQGPVTSDFEGNSQRADPERDERAFCLLRKRPPLLSSDLNPVPAGQESGKTTVSWDTCCDEALFFA